MNSYGVLGQKFERVVHWDLDENGHPPKSNLHQSIMRIERSTHPYDLQADDLVRIKRLFPENKELKGT